MGIEIFFDGKFSDIPNTVLKASEVVAKENVKMFNVHTNCGIESLKAANKVKHNSILLGVTVLTSIQESECQSLYGKSIETKVTELASLALEAGLDGIVCSPSDLAFLNKNNSLKKLLKVTPGIRPLWAQANDQKRTLTPKEAFELGADYLVIGRPLTNPPAEIGSSVKAAEKILKDL
jgi:orotidine-5'-phosphate decarboxylase